jgi:hypothetical protein
MNDRTSCACALATAQYDLFAEWRDLEPDLTEGRYADVTISKCRVCGQLWLRYHVEYEAFSRSGRWARGRIDESRALTIKPQEGPAFLASLPTYLYGGSWFDGQAGEGSGPMNWGI